MQPINVVICTGTACYVMGAASLLSVKEEVDAELSARIQLSGCSCMGFCKQQGQGRAPFAKVNETVITDATLNKLIAEIKNLA